MAVAPCGAKVCDVCFPAQRVLRTSPAGRGRGGLCAACAVESTTTDACDRFFYCHTFGEDLLFTISNEASEQLAAHHHQQLVVFAHLRYWTRLRHHEEFSLVGLASEDDQLSTCELYNKSDAAILVA